MLLLCLQLVFQAPSQAPTSSWFREVSSAQGIKFQHQDGRSGQRFFVETSASGGGWLDYDADGDLDLYFVNGALSPGSKPGPSPRNALYENRAGSFVEVTQKSGLGDTGYGMGFCVGDYDADGHLDLFITNYGPDRLYRNRGDHTFEEVSAQARVAGSSWGTGSAFGDLDGDGDLDLYVANYVTFSYDNNPRCGNAMSNTHSYCRPNSFKGQNDYLYINQGNGRFREQSLARGIRQGLGSRSFGVVLSDIDNDGDLDILVAVDGTMNHFYINNGKGYFEDQSELSGFAYNRQGAAEAGMGLDVGDVDGDGLLDTIVTHYAHETNTLYRQQKGMYFDDVTVSAGLAMPSLEYVGWGVALFDGDNDGDLDLAVANGHVIDNIALIEPGATYAQPNQIFANNGRGHFTNISDWAGLAQQKPRVSRGLAVGDYNNDGRLDLLICNTNDQVELYENVNNSGYHWLGLHLKGPKSNLFAIGAQVQLEGRPGIREVRSGGSFMSQGDLRLKFGLATHSVPVTALIRWPNGRRQVERITQLNRYHSIQYQP